MADLRGLPENLKAIRIIAIKTTEGARKFSTISSILKKEASIEESK